MVVLQFNVEVQDLSVLDYICERYQCDYDTALKILLGFYYNNLKITQKRCIDIHSSNIEKEGVVHG